MGLEAAGEVVKKGSNVTDLEIGDRVIYGGQSGGYAEYINIDNTSLEIQINKKDLYIDDANTEVCDKFADN